MLEMDLNVSKDGELVVMHDLIVDRTTDGTGAIRSLTLNELKRLNAGVKMAPEFTGLQIPTFDEFCQLVGQHPHLLLNVEIKDKTEECTKKAIRTLNRYNLIPMCVFTCFDADILRLIYQKYDLPTQGFPRL